MQDKDLEKILQQKADSVPQKDFSIVWEEIKEEIKQPEKKKKFGWKKWFPMVLASAVLVVCLALSPVIINSLMPPKAPQEEVFFSDELSKQDVLEEEMLNGLLQANINHVSLVEYELDDCKLLLTEDNKIKGASFNMYNNPTTFYSKIKLHHKSVDLSVDLNVAYDTIYKVNTTDVYYKFKQESSGLYEYSIYALHNGVKYLIEYSGASNDITVFLNEFFG